MLDLLVAGAGPAGLATAILAARHGMRVRVVDPRAGVIDKACGEGLMPAAAAALQALGVGPLEGHPLVGVRYVQDGAAAEGRFASGQGLGVRRTTLHGALLAQADALGVDRVVGRLADVRQFDDRVEVAGHEARWLVAADGLYSPLRHRLGLDQKSWWPCRYGLTRHYAIAPWTDMVEVHWAPNAEAYVTPVAPDQVGVAILYGQQCRDHEGAGGTKPFDALLTRFPALLERIGDAVVGPTRGAGPFAHVARSRVAGRVLLVGDAAGFMDPITGEGVKLGVQSARAAVDALVAGRPTAYEPAWRAIWRPYARVTGALLAVSRGPTRRALVPVLQRCPGLFDRVLATLSA